MQEKDGNGVAKQEDADLAADADSQPVGNNDILCRYYNIYSIYSAVCLIQALLILALLIQALLIQALLILALSIKKSC